MRTAAAGLQHALLTTYYHPSCSAMLSASTACAQRAFASASDPQATLQPTAGSPSTEKQHAPAMPGTSLSLLRSGLSAAMKQHHWTRLATSASPCYLDVARLPANTRSLCCCGHWLQRIPQRADQEPGPHRAQQVTTRFAGQCVKNVSSSACMCLRDCVTALIENLDLIGPNRCGCGGMRVRQSLAVSVAVAQLQRVQQVCGNLCMAGLAKNVRVCE